LADLTKKIAAAVNRLTLEQIAQAQDIKQKDVIIPEWGGSVTIRSLTQLEATRISDETVTYDGEKRTLNRELYQKRVLQTCMVFPTVDEAGAEMLLSKGKNAVEHLIEEIEAINGRDASPKAVEDSFRVEPEKVQHVLPGDEAGDDSPQAANG
jgi:hypothetical protein